LLVVKLRSVFVATDAFLSGPRQRGWEGAMPRGGTFRGGGTFSEKKE